MVRFLISVDSVLWGTHLKPIKVIIQGQMSSLESLFQAPLFLFGFVLSILLLMRTSTTEQATEWETEIQILNSGIDSES